MQLGIFAKVFQGGDVDAVLDAVVEHGFEVVHFNMACAGLESMPEEISEEVASKVRNSLVNHRLAWCGLSATFNTTHPGRTEREKGIRRFKALAGKARYMGTDFLSLCTGTRNTRSMWKHHPENGTEEAWGDLVETMALLLEIAGEFDLRLGIEPEINNVVDSPERALRLLNELDSPRLRVIMDPANIFRFEDIPRMNGVLKNAFGLLGPYISIAHAKDVICENPLRYGAAGTGVLDYSLYIELLRESGYAGPLVLHSLSEQEVPASRKYLKSLLR